MRAWPLLLVLAVLAAGCAAPPAPPSAAPPPASTPATHAANNTSAPAPGPPASSPGSAPGNATNGSAGNASAANATWFRAPATLPSDLNTTGEPSVVVDGKGEVFVSAPPGVGHVSLVWRSTDDGRTFQQLTNVFPDPGGTGRGGGDSALAVDAGSGALFASDLSPSGLTASWSRDQGQTWCQSSLASFMPGDRQWLAAGNGQGYLLYRALVSGQAGTYLSTFVPPLTDLQCVWAPGSLVGTDAVFNGNLVVDPGKALDLVYLASSDNGSHVDTVRFARSADGSSWAAKDIARLPGHSAAYVFASLASDRAGNLYAAWADDHLGTVDVWLSHSADRGATWSAPLRVSPDGGTHVMPWLAAGDSGLLDVVWYATDTPGNPNDASAMANATWRVELAQVRDALGAANVTRVTVAEGVHVGTISTKGLVPNGPDRDLGDFFQVALTPDGRAVVSYAQDGATSSTAIKVAVQERGPRVRA